MTIHINLIGRFGNCMFQYAYARALAEEEETKLTTSRWVGDEIFYLPDHSPDGETAELVEGYHQDQASMIYTRKQVKEWFRIKPGIQNKLREYLGHFPVEPVVAHRRAGDYINLGYVVVSQKSYYEALNELGQTKVMFISEEHPALIEGLPDFLPDFYRLMIAKTILRANSTFSWWAATLSNAEVYAPVIDGLEGGREQDCKFVKGNWPRFANLPFVTDLHLPE